MPLTSHRHSDASEHPLKAPAYDRYAEIYDRIGQRSFGERIAGATLAYLMSRDLHPKTAVDFACGTGAATLILAAAGLSVTGIDRSAPMLAQARCSAERAGLHVDWCHVDMRDVSALGPVELVTCFYDGINYLVSPDELATVFGHVARVLAPGGLFIFDLNTRAKFASNWNESLYVAVDRDDLFGIYRSWFEPTSGFSPLVMTFFMRTLDGRWERFDEEHVERAYELSDVREILSTAGLEVIDVLDYRDQEPLFGGVGSELSHRVVFVVRRPPDGIAGVENQP